MCRYRCMHVGYSFSVPAVLFPTVFRIWICSLDICMDKFTCVCVDTHTHTIMSVAYIYIYIYTHTNTYIYIYMFIYICMYVILTNMFKSAGNRGILKAAASVGKHCCLMTGRECACPLLPPCPCLFGGHT